MDFKKRFLDILNFERVDSFLALTYEYQDEILWHLAGGDKKKSKSSLFRVKPVVFYDSRKTAECQRSHPFLEHHPVHLSRGIHHSKAYCFIEGQKARLVLGSANLTFPGLTKNRETLAIFSDPMLLTQFHDFLKTNYKYDGFEGYRNYQAFLEKLSKFRTSAVSETISLLTNGYGTKGVENLTAFWRKFETAPATSVLVVSPFLDRKEMVVQEFEAAELLSKGASFCLLTSFDDETNFPVTRENANYYKTNFQFSTFSSLLGIKKGNNEWNEILENNKNHKFGKDAEFKRPLHSKIILLQGEHGLAIYVGSANFTSRGWLGINREIGAVQYIPGANFDHFRDSIMEQMGALKIRLDFSKLPVDLVFDPDQEEVNHDYYPSFISSILLKFDDNKVPYFKVECSAPISSEYSFHWGEIKLELENHVFKLSKEEHLGNILNNRNITVVHSSGARYYIPYKLADIIFENIESVYYKNSDDWLSQFGKREAFDWDYTPTQEEETGLDGSMLEAVNEELSIDRNQNFTIKMQQYLNYLTGFERYLSDRIAEVDKQKQIFEFREDDPNDLPAYIRLLIRELKKSKHIDIEVFKLGEIAQILRKMNQSHPSESIVKLRREILTELKATLAQKGHDKKTPYSQYIRLINGN